VLTKVTLGEVDAGVVYVTDVQAAGSKVKGIQVPAAQNATTSYPIVALTKAKHPKAAQQFVDLVLSAEGGKVLQAAGFQKP
jgi:molybdate transport system substrate-binding protein